MSDETKQTVWEKIRDLKKEAGEAAFNEKVYLLLRLLLKEQKYFNKETDAEIIEECNNLHDTWDKYLDNENPDINFEDLKKAYFTCEPKVEKKLKNYVGKRTGEIATKAKESSIRGAERARELGKQAVETVRKKKAEILEKSRQFSQGASLKYKKAHGTMVEIAKRIKDKIHSLSGPSRDKVLDEEVKKEVEASGITDEEEKAKYKENLKKFLELEIDTSNVEKSQQGSYTVGGARLSRKRNRKKKKRKTRRNRKLN